MVPDRRLLVAAVAIAIPLAAGVIATNRTAAPIRAVNASETCTDRATDSDVEYAGDNDTWCAVSGLARPSPPAPSATAPPIAVAPRPSATPTSSAQPSAHPTPVPPSSPAAPPPAAAGPFPVSFFAPGFTGPPTRQFAQQFITQQPGFVQVTYPAGSTSPSSGAPGGAQARLAISRGATTDATLTYQVRFPVGFQWVKGGKLPGLCGGQCWTGSSNGPGGWATRFMWRGGGAGEVLLSDATTTGYGSDLGLGRWQFQADGQWHTLSQHIHLNTPGAADGFIDVAYNGALVAHLTGITFRTDTATQVDSLMFSTFFGGHDSTWAPSTTQHIDFAAFRLA